MKELKQLHNIEFICFAVGVVAACIADLIPDVGFLRFLGIAVVLALGFTLAVILVEVYLYKVLIKPDGS